MAHVRIVYVGGTESDRAALEAILRGDGLTSLRACTPGEALDALRADAVDLLLIDLMQTSHDVLVLMKAAFGGEPGARRVPVVVSAPLEHNNRVQACLQRGADDFVTTPFDPANPLLVKRRLDQCLERRSARPETAATPVQPTVRVPIGAARAPTPDHHARTWEKTVHRFIPREFLELLERRSLADVKLGDHVQREMTVFFSDIRDFTHLSERLTPAENFSFLTSYLRNVTPIIRNHGGFVDKYLGDGVMALFPGEPIHAVRAAVDLLKQLERYNLGRQSAGYVPIKIGMGLHSGSLMLGTIGAEDQMQTTVIADAVNLASRIEGMTKTFGVSLLLSGSVVAGLPVDHTFRLRALGAVKAKGKDVSVEIFECYDNDPDELLAHKDATAAQFARGMEKFRAGKFLSAGAIFARVAEFSRDDLPAAYFRDRCSLSVVRERGSARWDGAEHIEVK